MDKESIYLSCIFVLLSIIVIGLFNYFVFVGVEDFSIVVEEYPISCSSYSMGWIASCNDTIVVKPINVTNTVALTIGRVYLYRNDGNISKYVLHRYVGAYNDSVAIFKGDRNMYIEMVNVTDIRYIVTEVKYGSMD